MPRYRGYLPAVWWLVLLLLTTGWMLSWQLNVVLIVAILFVGLDEWSRGRGPWR
jgi:hypothetical protein